MTANQPNALPDHIGIIMDGNGRWAKNQGKPRIYGHTKAVNAITESIRFCVRYNIKALTLYAFSTENWKRSKSEVNHLMKLIKNFIDRETEKLMEHNIRMYWTGRRTFVTEPVRKKIEKTEALTAKNTGLILNFAFDYGSREEITQACRRIAVEVAAGSLHPEDISEDLINTYLYTASSPEVDLVIRTSGEKRVSNFMLWQAAYAEYCFFDEYWPEFNESLMLKALEEFAGRKRRKGGLDESENI